ncbi:MAG: restriction endonuclease subunit S, partial [Gammaproteobacteria bacterium]|nr:restriction endonuclease subunit S [Gammaproteobacteria bacterium]
SERLWDIPPTWEWSRIGELGNVVSGGTPPTKVSKYWEGDIIWFAPSDLTGYKRKFIERGAKTLTKVGLAKSSAKLMPAGSVMFSSRAPVGYTAINTKPSATNQGFKSIVPHDGLFNEYLYYYLQAAKQIAEQRATGTTFKELSGSAFGALPVPLAPTCEQRRIVEKIEALFAEIDKGVESLQAAKSTLDLYRKSLLKSAFEGRLTADWRSRNPDKLEDPETLFARIRKEREASYQTALADWEQSVTKWKENGEKGKKPAKPKKMKHETMQPLLSLFNVPLPSSWLAAKVVTVLDIVSGATPKGINSCNGKGIPFFKISDMNAKGNEIELSQASLNLSANEAQALGLVVCPAGTIVFPKRGGAILTNKKRRLCQPSCFDLNTMGLVNQTKTVLQKFAYYWMLGVDLSAIYDGSNVPQINNKNVEPLCFPICSPDEQAQIVRILDARFEALEVLQTEINATFARAEALRQSILKRAFSGKLVPQDPNDEPATVLLERIKAERTVTSRKPATRKHKAAHR